MYMKKIFLSSVIALFAGLSVFAQDATATMPKFAYVDFSVLVQLMPEMDEARNTMEASSNEAQETYKGMVEEYQKKLEQYQQKAATWTAAIRESKEKELGEFQNRITEFQEAIRQELQEQQQKLMMPIQKKAIDAVNELAKAKGFAIVFDKSSVLYIDDAQCVDLMSEARTALNIPADRTIESLQAELQAKAAAAANRQ